MEQQIINEENKKTTTDIFQGLLDNPLISQVSNTVINTLSEHIKNSTHHEDNDKQQDSGVDDIEEAFQKIDSTKNDNVSNINENNHEKKDNETKNEHNPINDFFNNQLESQIGGFVGNIATNVIDTVKNELFDGSFDHIHDDSRNKTPEPTKEEFVLPNDNEKHPQEPSGINLGNIIANAKEILKNNEDKIHDIVQTIIPSIDKGDHNTEAPQEPQIDNNDKSKGNSNNMSIPKVDIIAPSPLPIDKNENTPIEPIHDVNESSSNDIIDDIKEEFSCVKIKGYTNENNNVNDVVDINNDVSNTVEIDEPSIINVNEEILLKKDNTKENDNVLVNHEITIHSHEEIKHNEPFIEIKQEIEEKVQIPPPVAVPIKADIKKTSLPSDNKKTTTSSTKQRITTSTTKTSTKTPISTRSNTSSKALPSKTGTSNVMDSNKSTVKSTVPKTNDKVPSYARPTGASQRASTIGVKSSNTTQSPSKSGSLSSSSSIRPLPRVTNKYKDVKSKVFSTITTQTSTEKSSPKPTTKQSSNGIKPLPKTKLNWKAESKIGSFANIQHKPSGGQVKTLNNKPNPPTTKIGNVKVELPGNINPLSSKEALGQ